MSDQKKKRKDKKKKKDMLDARLKEEYQDERAHIGLMNSEEFDGFDDLADYSTNTLIDFPTDNPVSNLVDETDDSNPIIEENDDGSGACVKIVFLVLISCLGLAVGVIFFEMGGIQTLTNFNNVEPAIEQTHIPNAPVAFEEDFVEDSIEPSPLQTDSLKEEELIPDTPPIVEEAPEEISEPNEEVPQENVEPVEAVEEVVETKPTLEETNELVVDVEQTPEERVEEVIEPVEEIQQTVNENFETQLENDPVDVPQESFTMRAEREAVQEAVDQVWVMTVRCIEELRALQVMAKSSLTLSVIDSISQRLEPLRSELDQLVKSTSESRFDGALEQAAHLERHLRAVLDELDSARTQDTVLAEEEARKEELAARQAEELAARQAEELAARQAEELAAQQAAELAAQAAQDAEELDEEIEAEINIDPVVEDTVQEDEDDFIADAPSFDQALNEPEEEVEPEVQADEPVAQANVEADPQVIEVAQEQVVDPPAVISEPELPREEEEVPSEEDNEVEEPVQVAKEAFTVGPEEQLPPPVPEQIKSEASPSNQDLEEADRLVDQSPAQALALMEQILEKDPANALALYGRARSLDSLAEVERSNARLEQSIFAYRAVLDLEDRISDELYLKTALRCIDRMRFRGFHGKSIRIQQRLAARFPDVVDYQNQLAVGFLLLNQPDAARTVLESILQRWPNSGFAQVHLGFILKTTYDDYEAGAKWMMAGLATREEGVIDGRFYTHLGDALSRLGRHQEAQKVYADGETEGVFLSRHQRSLYNVDRLTAKPWWSKDSTPYGPFFDLLEANWRQIRDEAVALMSLQAPEGFADESEKLRNTGDWKQYELFAQGKKNVQHCSKAPMTCTLIENYPPALCKRGQVKFSIMHPGTHVWPHTGPTNCRIRAHLGLVVPEGTHLRVTNTTKSWEEGKFLIFDDSFEHEVWHNGSSFRLVLIIDLWHPELTADEWRSLAPI